MELPDRLYGVTMEEPGISKLVGVDIRDEDQDDEDDDSVPQMQAG